MSLYNLPAARTPEQLEMMKDLEDREVCIFCPEHIQEEDSSPIEIETDHWMVKKNTFPYKDTRVHLLAIPKVHVSTLSALGKLAQVDFFDVISQCETMYDLHSYALVVRSGDMRNNGGSIEHLHAHIIAGDTDDPNHQPVRVKISSRG